MGTLIPTKDMLLRVKNCILCKGIRRKWLRAHWEVPEDRIGLLKISRINSSKCLQNLRFRRKLGILDSAWVSHMSQCEAAQAHVYL